MSNMIRQIDFDTDDELNNKISRLKKELVLGSGGRWNGSLRVISLFRQKWPNAFAYEAWVEVKEK